MCDLNNCAETTDNIRIVNVCTFNEDSNNRLYELLYKAVSELSEGINAHCARIIGVNKEPVMSYLRDALELSKQAPVKCATCELYKAHENALVAKSTISRLARYAANDRNFACTLDEVRNLDSFIGKVI